MGSFFKITIQMYWRQRKCIKNSFKHFLLLKMTLFHFNASLNTHNARYNIRNISPQHHHCPHHNIPTKESTSNLYSHSIYHTRKKKKVHTSILLWFKNLMLCRLLLLLFWLLCIIFCCISSTLYHVPHTQNWKNESK